MHPIDLKKDIHLQENILLGESGTEHFANNKCDIFYSCNSEREIIISLTILVECFVYLVNHFIFFYLSTFVNLLYWLSKLHVRYLPCACVVFFLPMIVSCF